MVLFQKVYSYMRDYANSVIAIGLIALGFLTIFFAASSKSSTFSNSLGVPLANADSPVYGGESSAGGSGGGSGGDSGGDSGGSGGSCG